jgi:hypothetical protein
VNKFPFITYIDTWKWLVKRHIILISSVAIGLGMASLDANFTSPDFYHMDKGISQRGADLNNKLISIIVLENPNTEIKELRQDYAKRLKKIYISNNLSRIMITFEFLELFVMGFLVSILMWSGYLCLRILGSENPQIKNNSEQIRNFMLCLIPYCVIAILAYLFWPPFRQYNIYEISYGHNKRLD